MRVPTYSNSAQMLERINQLSTKQSLMQTQVASGQRIFQPEDDPAAVGRVLTLDAEKRRLEQFKSNSTRALDISQATYSSLNSMKKISDRASELATLASGSVGTETYAAYSSELDQLIEQGIQVANSKLGNDYLFSGNTVDVSPFTRVPATGSVTSITYGGSTTNGVEIRLSSDSSIEPGSDVATNQGIGTFLNNLVALRDALNAGNKAAVFTAKDLITGTDTVPGDEDMLVSALSQHGATQTRIEIAQTQMTDRLDNITKLVSGEVEVDLPEALTKLNQTSIAYQAALQSASQIMKVSLLDYLN